MQLGRVRRPPAHLGERRRRDGVRHQRREYPAGPALGECDADDEPIDRLSRWPSLRELTLRLPKALWPVPEAYGHIVAFDASGRVVADLQDAAGRLPETSGVTEYAGQIYVHSLHASAIGMMPSP